MGKVAVFAGLVFIMVLCACSAVALADGVADTTSVQNNEGQGDPGGAIRGLGNQFRSSMEQSITDFGAKLLSGNYSAEDVAKFKEDVRKLAGNFFDALKTTLMSWAEAMRGSGEGSDNVTLTNSEQANLWDEFNGDRNNGVVLINQIAHNNQQTGEGQSRDKSEESIYTTSLQLGGSTINGFQRGNMLNVSRNSLGQMGSNN